MTMDFEFLDGKLNEIDGRDYFVMLIPSGIQTKSELFDCFGKLGHFPGYFGRSWDALFDCLLDFTWMDIERVMIIHRDIPMSGKVEDCKIYLEVLQDALLRMSETSLQQPGFYVYQELRVLFPNEARLKVLSLLEKA